MYNTPTGGAQKRRFEGFAASKHMGTFVPGHWPRTGHCGGLDRLSALEQLRTHQPSVVTLDLGLPPDARGAAEGFAALTQIQREVVLRRALHVQQIEHETRELLRIKQRQGFEEILGASPAMQDVFTAIRKVAPTDAPC